MTLLTSGSVRNKLRVDAGCSKVHASAWKASEKAPISLKIILWPHGVTRLQSIPGVSPASRASPDVFSITGYTNAVMLIIRPPTNPAMHLHEKFIL